MSRIVLTTVHNPRINKRIFCKGQLAGGSSCPPPRPPFALDECGSGRQFSLYTILSLSLPILYGVRHIIRGGGSGGGYPWRKSRAIVLQ